MHINFHVPFSTNEKGIGMYHHQFLTNKWRPLPCTSTLSLLFYNWSFVLCCSTPSSLFYIWWLFILPCTRSLALSYYQWSLFIYPASVPPLFMYRWFFSLYLFIYLLICLFYLYQFFSLFYHWSHFFFIIDHLPSSIVHSPLLATRRPTQTEALARNSPISSQLLLPAEISLHLLETLLSVRGFWDVRDRVSHQVMQHGRPGRVMCL